MSFALNLVTRREFLNVLGYLPRECLGGARATKLDYPIVGVTGLEAQAYVANINPSSMAPPLYRLPTTIEFRYWVEELRRSLTDEDQVRLNTEYAKLYWDRERPFRVDAHEPLPGGYRNVLTSWRTLTVRSWQDANWIRTSAVLPYEPNNPDNALTFHAEHCPLGYKLPERGSRTVIRLVKEYSW